MEQEMKIVLNKCYGGFSLSEEQALAYGIPEEELYDRGDSKVYYDEVERTDPKLVAVVEQGLPDAWASNLVVVEIPDNAFYRIEQHDGNEYIIYSESEIHFA
jgi:hypothetical protein